MIYVVLVEAEHAAEHWGWRLNEDRHHRFDDEDGDWDDRSPGGCTYGIPQALGRLVPGVCQ